MEGARSSAGARILLAGFSVAAATNAQGPQFVFEVPNVLPSVQADRIAVADFNTDGAPDLLVLDPWPSNLVLLQNAGDVEGRLAMQDVTASFLHPMLSGGLRAVTPVDVDGDGDLDLALGTGPFRIGLNVGTGLVPGAIVSGVDYADQIVPADLDSDGDLDLVLIWAPGPVTPRPRILVNDGVGGFTAGVQFPLLTPSGLTFYDYDHDGDGDLLFTIDNGIFYNHLLRNDGNMLFTYVTATDLSVPDVLFESMAVGDVDGDGLDELVATGGNADYVLEAVGGVLSAVQTLPAQSMRTRTLALGDVDGDGDLDLLRGNFVDGTVLDFNDGSGNFAPAPGRLPPGFLLTHQHALADMDGDGDADIVSNLETWYPLVLRNRDVDLEVSTATIGAPWSLTLRSRPGYAAAPEPAVLAIGLTALAQPVAMPGLGTLRLDLSGPTATFATLLSAPDGRASVSFPIPNVPGLVGLDLHAQGLVARGGTALALTALRSVAVK